MSAVPARARVAKPNGWWGMAVFVATEATLFGTLLGTYFYLRFHAIQWPPGGIPAPGIAVPLVLTAVIVATSGPMLLAARAADRGDAATTRRLLLLALVVQSGYFAMQMHEYLGDVDRVLPGLTAYGSIYVTLLGAHHFHVAVGLLLNLFLVVRLAWGLNRYRAVGVRAAAFYWHFVNVLALVVVATQLSANA